MTQNIKNHSGNKYLREIVSPVDGSRCIVDVYAVLKAFDIKCQARGHAIKKLLCSGIRGKGDIVQDLSESIDAINRSIDLAKDDQKLIEKQTTPTVQVKIPEISKEQPKRKLNFCGTDRVGLTKGREYEIDKEIDIYVWIYDDYNEYIRCSKYDFMP